MKVVKVPPWWEHPKNENGEYIVLYIEFDIYDYYRLVAEWERGKELWEKGEYPGQAIILEPERWEEYSKLPNKALFREIWLPEERTMYQCYENMVPLSMPKRDRAVIPVSCVMNKEDIINWIKENVTLDMKEFIDNMVNKADRMVYNSKRFY
jgi:hypothetical protein